jgi:protein involved in polysaccharide export with SLBB domain
LGQAGFVTLVLSLGSGCVTNRQQVEPAAIADRAASAPVVEVSRAYHVRCPDVLQVNIVGLPQYSGRHPLGPDGRLDLGDAGRPPVDGETTPEIVRTVAQVLSVPPQQVDVEVAEYNSQFVYLFGQIAGAQRAVPYQGPETVMDLLRRVGGLRAGAAVGDITVIRPHIADGKTPEIFHLDLNALVAGGDAEANIFLEPYDQVHIGQSRRARFGDCLPPWLRPVYNRLCGMKRRPSLPPVKPSAG